MATPFHSTPVKNTCNSATKFAATIRPLTEQCDNMDSEMRKHFVGPMPVRQFLDEFLPVQIPPERRDRLPSFEAMTGVRLESQMYNTFTEVANLVCHKIKAFNTSNNPSIEEDAVCKPDITFYNAKTCDSRNPVTSFQRMEMFVEFKRGNTSDPFQSDNRQPFWKLFENTCATRGQIILYSTRQQTYQFRTCTFSVGIFGNVARLFRWDRAGAIVSEPIPYCEEGNHDLAEFFCRFDLMDRSQRGWDPTVIDATEEEATAFDNAIRAIVGEGQNSLLSKLFDSVGNKDHYPRRRIEIPAGEDRDGEVVSYIIGRSIASAKSPTGRATRCFVAMSKDTGSLVFLKDSWRPNIDGMMGEAYWFRKAEGARNISSFLRGSDVPGVVVEKRTGSKNSCPVVPGSLQRTLTDLYSGKYDGLPGMVGYIHYRTVQSEFYVPLNMFKDSKHLTQIIHDVVIAIQDLYDRGILHRDISAANVMINVEGGGRLIDLDLAKERTDSHARRSVRTGTWQFMSTRLLSTPGKPHEICDDLESLWFVLLFESLHFVKHNNPDDIDMPGIFDQMRLTPNTGTHKGGAGKRDLYYTSVLVCKMLEFDSEPFTALVRKIYRLFRSLNIYYTTQDNGDLPDDDAKNAFKKLKNSAEIERLLGEALKSGGWPEGCDRVNDQYPPAKRPTPKQKETIALSYANQSFVSSGAPSEGKRKREEEDDPVPPNEAKRSKISLPP